jgi:hypothetical protein
MGGLSIFLEPQFHLFNLEPRPFSRFHWKSEVRFREQLPETAVICVDLRNGSGRLADYAVSAFASEEAPSVST